MERGLIENTHPGELIYEDILKENNLTVSEAAIMLNITRAALSNVLNKKAGVSPNMALRIQKVFGGTALFWLRLQVAYDLRRAEKTFVGKSLQSFNYKKNEEIKPIY